MSNILQIISEAGNVHVTTDKLTITFVNCIYERVNDKKQSVSFKIYDSEKKVIAVFTTSLDTIENIN